MTAPILKVRAKKIRSALSDVAGITISHSQSLEVVAREENYPNWDAACASFSAPLMTRPAEALTSETDDESRDVELAAIGAWLDRDPEGLNRTALMTLRDCLVQIRWLASNAGDVYSLADSAHNLPFAMMSGDADYVRECTLSAIYAVRRAKRHTVVS